MIRRALIVALAFCAPGAAAAQNVAEVQVAPPSVTIRVGERSGLLATAFDRIGNVIPTVRIIWSSNNVGVAKVDNNGTVTGVANGVAIIEARVGARRSQAAVQVTGGGPASPPPVCRATGGHWTGCGIAARARGGLSAAVREHAGLSAGAAGGRLCGGTRHGHLDIAATGRGERRSERERCGAVPWTGHNPGYRLGRPDRDRARRRAASGIHGARGLAPDALARRGRYAACHRRHAEQTDGQSARAAVGVE